MSQFSFEVLSTDGEARAGKLITPHGMIEMPSFVAVGTLGTVRAVSAEDLRKIGTQVIIANTYHLHLQPGEDLIEQLGGLHRFINWGGPLMTDSGGFQIFSLGAAKEHGVGKIASIFPEDDDRGRHFKSKKRRLVKIDEEGAEFVSYLDGSRHRFTPEGVIASELKLGADIILTLDECTSPLHDYNYTRKAMERTHRWTLRALEAYRQHSEKDRAIFGIIQGGAYRDLREESAVFMANKEFEGYAIGGSLGRSKDDMHRVLEWTVPFMPQDRPRHLLGVGTVEDIFEVVTRGIDLFDCSAPTRMAQTGTVFSKEVERYTMHLLNSQYREDPGPIEEGCGCGTCNNYSRAFLRHLFAAGQPSAVRLATIHNLHFVESMMREIRRAIREGRL
ncbi:MAG: tRNA guanosine(34) transglycosylase Tgt, partial [Desulfobacteraceae bacterium]